MWKQTHLKKRLKSAPTLSGAGCLDNEAAAVQERDESQVRVVVVTRLMMWFKKRNGSYEEPPRLKHAVDFPDSQPGILQMLEDRH